MSSASEDSGRGKSRSPSTTPAKELVAEAYADVAREIEVQSSTPQVSCDCTRQLVTCTFGIIHSVFPLQFIQQQPKLFKSHEEILGRAQQGIASISAENSHPSPTRRKMPFLKRLFSRKNPTSEDGSHLSIDYDQFCITDAPQAKRFSDSHINPEVSFNEEGKLPQNVEMELIMATADNLGGAVEHIEYIENDIYESESCSSKPSGVVDVITTEELPVTSIDDVEVASDFDVYEQVRPGEDFHAM